MSGTPIFVRQVLDDLPTLLARLRGETPPTPAAIRMPAPSPPQSLDVPPPAPEVPGPASIADEAADGNGTSLEARVLAALRSSAHPLPVVGIRDRLGPGISGQQVRRILERAGAKVVASDERPIRYRLR